MASISTNFDKFFWSIKELKKSCHQKQIIRDQISLSKYVELLSVKPKNVEYVEYF